MAIRKRQTQSGPRWDVEVRLPDRSKRRRTFRTEREARMYEAEVVTARANGSYVDPRAGRLTLTVVYESWIAGRPDLSPKVQRGYRDNWKLRVEPQFGLWPVAKIDRNSIQAWVNQMSSDGLGPRTVRWTHSVLKMCLDHAAESGLIAGRNPAATTNFPPLPRSTHIYLTAPQVARLSALCGSAQGDVVPILAYTGMRWGELCGLNVEDVDLVARRLRIRRSITQVGGKLTTGLPKTRAGYRSIPIPERLVAALEGRLSGRLTGDPAISAPKGGRLGRENWVRAVDWKKQVTALGQPAMRIHDLRHTFASLARSAGADLRLVQKTMGHASITVTAHTYADLYDDDLDRVAAALDLLGD